MAYKNQLVFRGKRDMSVDEAIQYGKVCITRFIQGDVAALHDVWYIVNSIGVPLDTITDDPVTIASNYNYNRLETLV